MGLYVTVGTPPSDPKTQNDCSSTDAGATQSCTTAVSKDDTPVWIYFTCGAPGPGYQLPAYILEVTWTPSR